MIPPIKVPKATIDVQKGASLTNKNITKITPSIIKVIIHLSDSLTFFIQIVLN